MLCEIVKGCTNASDFIAVGNLVEACLKVEMVQCPTSEVEMG